MNKDIMKNDKVVEDILQEFSAMREKSQISYVWKEVHNRYGIDIDVWLGDKLRSLTKPTTDIDEAGEKLKDKYYSEGYRQGYAEGLENGKGINGVRAEVYGIDLSSERREVSKRNRNVRRILQSLLPYLKGSK